MNSGSRWMMACAPLAVLAACQRVDKVEVSPHAATLQAPGASVVIAAKVVDQHNVPLPKAVVTFMSDNPDVATVDANGNVTARITGTVHVSAKSENKADAATVEVRIASRIQTAPELRIEGIGATAVVKSSVLDDLGRTVASPVTLTVADPSKAIVQPDGTTILTRGEGKTVITATAGVLSTPITLTVSLPDFASMSTTPSELSLKTGETRQLSTVALAADGTPMGKIPFLYTSSAPALATVDSGGLITAVAAGRATITAAAANKSAMVSVTVVKLPGS